MSMSSAASFRLWISALCSAGSFQTEFSGSSKYQRVREKPCQAVSERPALKENWIAMMTGAIDHTM